MHSRIISGWRIDKTGEHGGLKERQLVLWVAKMSLRRGAQAK